MFRKFFVILNALTILLPSAALAQATESVVPEFNPLCWKQADCIAERALLLGKNKDQLTSAEQDGWYQNESPCLGPTWGKCLPAGETITEISFGGQRKFRNIGDLVLTIYNYSLGVAGIVAVVMIFLAGLQWITSGGNSEAITSAKKRIGGALMGLFLLYASYFALRAINPNLVNLRLPTAWLIRGQNLMPQFCDEAPQGTLFALAAKETEQQKAVSVTSSPNYGFAYPILLSSKPSGGMPQGAVCKQDSDCAPPCLCKTGVCCGGGPVQYDEKNFTCGARFFPQGASSATCYGGYCGPGNLCVNFGGNNQQNPYHCTPGTLAGRVSGTAGGLSGIVIDNSIELHILCKDGTEKQVGETANVDNSQSLRVYLFNFDKNSAFSACGGPDKTAGFFMLAEVNDETGGLGAHTIEGAKWWVIGSWGIDDWHVVGTEGKGSHQCDVNLATVGNKIINIAPQCSSKVTYYGCSADFINGAGQDNLKSLAANKDFADRLISADDIKAGFQCDITINRTDFPAMDYFKDPEK